MTCLAKGLLVLAQCAYLSDADPVTSSALPPGFPCTLPGNLKVLADVATGWPGACLGLTQQTPTPATPHLCHMKCSAKDTCNVWQWVTPPTSSENECWIATSYYGATKCWGRDSSDEGGTSFKATAGQRIQHGTPVVVKNYTDVTYSGLTPLGSFSSADLATGISRCKNQCYSNIWCTKWEYRSGAPSGSNGCYLVDQPGTQSADQGTPLTGSLSVVGESLEHKCLDYTDPLPVAEKTSNVPWIIAIAVITLVILGVIVALYCLCEDKGEKKKKTTRGVKIVPRKAPPRYEPQEVLMPLVPMPILAPPVATYSVAPSFAAPLVTTYSAAPAAPAYGY